MRIRTETGGGRHEMGLAGRFDAHEVPALASAVQGLLAEPGCTVRVDLSSVVFVDSARWRNCCAGSGRPPSPAAIWCW